MNIKNLPTEQRNQNTLNIDEVSTLEMLAMINNEDKQVAFSVEKHLPQIAAAVDAVSKAFAAGGRIVYCGAGTSGRMGMMDSAECPPTFGVSADRVTALVAGGPGAGSRAVEGAEDSKESCVQDLKAIDFNRGDILVGIAASGRTPYVIGGIEYARALGALVVSVTCNEDADCEINRLSDYPIAIYAGPEAITGSTRMKAGTVQKMVLNMLSTAVMVKNGKVYGNLMVNVQITNEKLNDRAKRIIREITGASDEKITTALLESGGNTGLAIFMLLTGYEKSKAAEVLAQHNGHIKKAMAEVKRSGAEPSHTHS